MIVHEVAAAPEIQLRRLTEAQARRLVPEANACLLAAIPCPPGEIP